MVRPLDVLVIESEAGAGAAHADALAAAGHRVHRCYTEAEQPLCDAVTTGACPLGAGIDVALLVRRCLATEPGGREGGVSCALRAAVPVVEHGPELLDPFAPWIAARVAGDVVASCHAAATAAWDGLVEAIEARVATTLARYGLAEVGLRYEVEAKWPHLRILVTGPTVAQEVQQAIGVRALEAVRADVREFEKVDVTYRAA